MSSSSSIFAVARIEPSAYTLAPATMNTEKNYLAVWAAAVGIIFAATICVSNCGGGTETNLL
jgi:hypothetical protein